MSRRTARAARGLFLAGAALLAVGCGGEEQPVSWSFERMIDQPSARPYEASRFFPDSMAMRRPPVGTVSRATPPAGSIDPVVSTGRLAYRTAPAPDTLPGATPASQATEPEWVPRIPIRLGETDLAHGRDRFRIVCAACHGIDGRGESPVAANMRLRPPPSLLEPRLRAAPDGRIFAVISEGYGLMPSYAGHLDVRERWDVVAYVRALQLAQRARPGALPPLDRRELDRALGGTGAGGPP